MALMYPSDLEEAIETLNGFYEDLNADISAISEEDFLSSTHFDAGSFIRESWHLWWYEGHNSTEWPKEKPAIVKYFNELGITHADDISTIILSSTYRALAKKPIDLKGQIKRCQDFWKEDGLPNGTPEI